MLNAKNLIKAGAAVIGISIAAFIYNFFATYSLAEKCPDNIKTKPCKAYSNWTMTNKFGLVVLVIGLVIVVAGLVKRHQKKA